ncbi:type II toxin-antitoxin system VapC family toxin [Sulfolobus acidocaldarius]|uniref:Twitching motility protein PilT n=1 Tax=Sulfolobus acidocaldarius TaxID=2285 RepID=A0A0U2WV28_9CREN|nr:PIN domain-containing protein [Sulfolobus acidocaldarius]ALU29938.1 twitching motility protein PilT [Sulfolobus acidocaldarius]ALU32682.1 twitching motility protein PilT [Sulfolobus acidocaldarius]
MSDYCYVDTNVILSFVEQDANYERAREIVEERRGKLVTGEVTLLELSSFYSRKLKDDVLAKASVKYALKVCNVELVEIDFNRLFEKALQLSPRLKLKTLDVLQVVSASLVKASVFITFDKDIIAKEEIVNRVLGLNIVH